MESFSVLTHIFFLLIGTSDDYSSNNMSVAPDHGNNNDDGPITTHSIAVDGPPFDDDKMFNDPFAIPHSPDLASLSSSSEDENIYKKAVVLPVYPKHVKTRGGGSCSTSAVTDGNTWQKCSAWQTNSFCQKGSTTISRENITRYSKCRHGPCCG